MAQEPQVELNAAWTGGPLRVTQGLLDARASFQRLGDARIIHGWILEVNGAFLTVQAGDDPPLNKGESFAVRTSRLNGDVAFLAQLREATTPDAQEALRRATMGNRPIMLDFGIRNYVFEVMGQMFPMPASGDPRYVCDPAQMLVNGLPAEVRDISPGGIGAVSLAPQNVGDQVPVVVETTAGPIEFQAEVRYSRGRGTQPTIYRLGLRLIFEDRVERARWTTIVRDRSLASSPKRLPDEIEVFETSLPVAEETGLVWACHAAAPDLVFPWGTGRATRTVSIAPDVTVESKEPVRRLPPAPEPVPEVILDPLPIPLEEPDEPFGRTDPYGEEELREVVPPTVEVPPLSPVVSTGPKRPAPVVPLTGKTDPYGEEELWEGPQPFYIPSNL